MHGKFSLLRCINLNFYVTEQKLQKLEKLTQGKSSFNLKQCIRFWFSFKKWTLRNKMSVNYKELIKYLSARLLRYTIVEH